MKKTLKYFSLFIGALVSFTVFYFLFAFLFSVISVGENQVEQGEYEIYITTNGVHADFILPYKSDAKDWSPLIDKNDFLGFSSKEPKFISFGWGDKGFYLNTPTWDDLTFSTAFNALFSFSETVMHVQLWENKPLTYASCIKLNVTESQFQKLVDFIDSSFSKKEEEFLLIAGEGYSPNDNFYQAEGSYTLFYTCNTWVNEGFKEMNLRTALWTPFEQGIYYHLD